MADRLIFVENKNFAFKTSFHLEIDGGACAFEDIRCDVFLRPNFTMSGNVPKLNDINYLLANKFLLIHTYYLLFRSRMVAVK